MESPSSDDPKNLLQVMNKICVKIVKPGRQHVSGFCLIYISFQQLSALAIRVSIELKRHVGIDHELTELARSIEIGIFKLISDSE